MFLLFAKEGAILLKNRMIVALAGGADAKPRVRIAHLDTGYDPDHASLPLRLRKDLARNFVDEDKPRRTARL
jgi:hypothetical protein